MSSSSGPVLQLRASPTPYKPPGSAGLLSVDRAINTGSKGNLLIKYGSMLFVADPSRRATRNRPGLAAIATGDISSEKSSLHALVRRYANTIGDNIDLREPDLENDPFSYGEVSTLNQGIAMMDFVRNLADKTNLDSNDVAMFIGLLRGYLWLQSDESLHEEKGGNGFGVKRAYFDENGVLKSKPDNNRSSEALGDLLAIQAIIRMSQKRDLSSFITPVMRGSILKMLHPKLRKELDGKGTLDVLKDTAAYYLGRVKKFYIKKVGEKNYLTISEDLKVQDSFGGLTVDLSMFSADIFNDFAKFDASQSSYWFEVSQNMVQLGIDVFNYKEEPSSLPLKAIPDQFEISYDWEREKVVVAREQALKHKLFLEGSSGVQFYLELAVLASKADDKINSPEQNLYKKARQALQVMYDAGKLALDEDEYDKAKNKDPRIFPLYLNKNLDRNPRLKKIINHTVRYVLGETSLKKEIEAMLPKSGERDVLSLGHRGDSHAARLDFLETVMPITVWSRIEESDSIDIKPYGKEIKPSVETIDFIHQGVSPETLKANLVSLLENPRATLAHIFDATYKYAQRIRNTQKGKELSDDLLKKLEFFDFGQLIEIANAVLSLEYSWKDYRAWIDSDYPKRVRRREIKSLLTNRFSKDTEVFKGLRDENQAKIREFQEQVEVSRFTLRYTSHPETTRIQAQNNMGDIENLDDLLDFEKDLMEEKNDHIKVRKLIDFFKTYVIGKLNTGSMVELAIFCFYFLKWASFSRTEGFIYTEDIYGDLNEFPEVSGSGFIWTAVGLLEYSLSSVDGGYAEVPNNFRKLLDTPDVWGESKQDNIWLNVAYVNSLRKLKEGKNVGKSLSAKDHYSIMKILCSVLREQLVKPMLDPVNREKESEGYEKFVNGITTGTFKEYVHKKKYIVWIKSMIAYLRKNGFAHLSLYYMNLLLGEDPYQDINDPEKLIEECNRLCEYLEELDAETNDVAVLRRYLEEDQLSVDLKFLRDKELIAPAYYSDLRLLRGKVLLSVADELKDFEIKSSVIVIGGNKYNTGTELVGAYLTLTLAARNIDNSINERLFWLNNKKSEKRGLREYKGLYALELAALRGYKGEFGLDDIARLKKDDIPIEIYWEILKEKIREAATGRVVDLEVKDPLVLTDTLTAIGLIDDADPIVFEIMSSPGDFSGALKKIISSMDKCKDFAVNIRMAALVQLYIDGDTDIDGKLSSISGSLSGYDSEYKNKASRLRNYVNAEDPYVERLNHYRFFVDSYYEQAEVYNRIADVLIRIKLQLEARLKEIDPKKEKVVFARVKARLEEIKKEDRNYRARSSLLHRMMAKVVCDHPDKLREKASERAEYNDKWVGSKQLAYDNAMYTNLRDASLRDFAADSWFSEELPKLEEALAEHAVTLGNINRTKTTVFDIRQDFLRHRFADTRNMYYQLLIDEDSDNSDNWTGLIKQLNTVEEDNFRGINNALVMYGSWLPLSVKAYIQRASTLVSSEKYTPDDRDNDYKIAQVLAAIFGLADVKLEKSGDKYKATIIYITKKGKTKVSVITGISLDKEEERMIALFNRKKLNEGQHYEQQYTLGMFNQESQIFRRALVGELDVIYNLLVANGEKNTLLEIIVAEQLDENLKFYPDSQKLYFSQAIQKAYREQNSVGSDSEITAEEAMDQALGLAGDYMRMVTGTEHKDIGDMGQSVWANMLYRHLNVRAIKRNCEAITDGIHKVGVVDPTLSSRLTQAFSELQSLLDDQIVDYLSIRNVSNNGGKDSTDINISEVGDQVLFILYVQNFIKQVNSLYSLFISVWNQLVDPNQKKWLLTKLMQFRSIAGDLSLLINTDPKIKNDKPALDKVKDQLKNKDHWLIKLMLNNFQLFSNPWLENKLHESRFFNLISIEERSGKISEDLGFYRELGPEYKEISDNPPNLSKSDVWLLGYTKIIIDRNNKPVYVLKGRDRTGRIRSAWIAQAMLMTAENKDMYWFDKYYQTYLYLRSLNDYGLPVQLIGTNLGVLNVKRDINSINGKAPDIKAVMIMVKALYLADKKDEARLLAADLKAYLDKDEHSPQVIYTSVLNEGLFDFISTIDTINAKYWQNLADNSFRLTQKVFVDNGYIPDWLYVRFDRSGDIKLVEEERNVAVHQGYYGFERLLDLTKTEETDELFKEKYHFVFDIVIKANKYFQEKGYLLLEDEGLKKVHSENDRILQGYHSIWPYTVYQEMTEWLKKHKAPDGLDKADLDGINFSPLASLKSHILAAPDPNSIEESIHELDIENPIRYRSEGS